MPKYEVTLNGVRTQNFTYTTIIEADCLDEAYDEAETLDVDQKDWSEVAFDDITDNMIENDGVDEIHEIDEDTIEQKTGSISYQTKKEVKR